MNLTSRLNSFLDKFNNRIGDRLFARLHRLDFEGTIGREQLGLSTTSSFGTRHGYDASNSYVFRRLIRAFLQLDVNNIDLFIDIGSSKGKTAIYAEKFFNFNEVIGLELSETLLKTSIINAKGAGCRNVRFVLKDATEWHLPKKASAIYIFHSFDGTILKRFVENNLKVISDYSCYILYNNHHHSDVLIELGFECIWRDDNIRSSIYQIPKLQGNNK